MFPLFPPTPSPPFCFTIFLLGNITIDCQCSFHLQFYFVLQNHSGILDPKAIVGKLFSKPCRKKDYCYSLSLSFFLFFPCLCWWPLICAFRFQGKACFYVFRKSQCFFLSLQDATCAFCFLPRGLKSPQQCLLPSRSERLLCSKTLEQTLQVKPLHSLIEGGEEVGMYLEMHSIFV